MQSILRTLLLVPTLFAVGCSCLGSARSFDPGELDREPGWIAVRDVPLILQKEEEDCGAAAIAMVLEHWNARVSRDRILEVCPMKTGEGILAKDLRELARREGLNAYLTHGEGSDLEVELSCGHPVIVGLFKPYASGMVSHYEVVVALQPGKKQIITLDPANGWRRNSLEGFLQEWDPAGRLTLVPFREPTDKPPAAGGR